MNPEIIAIRNLDKRRRSDDIDDIANLLLGQHERVQKYMRSVAFDPNSFRDFYGDEAINDSLSYVTAKKQQFAETASRKVTDNLTEGDVRKLAERAEFEIYRGINVGNWIPMIKAFKTSEYDDIKWGVDMVLEFQNREAFGHIGLGVDVTFAQDVLKKFQRIKDDIDRFDGKKHLLSRVKYFESPRLGFRGELNHLTRVVIAVDLPMLEDMARAQKDMHSGHIARHEILMELEHQLAVFADYANRINKPALEPIQRAQNLVHRMVLIQESEMIIQQSEYGKNRGANESIQRGLQLFR